MLFNFKLKYTKTIIIFLFLFKLCIINNIRAMLITLNLSNLKKLRILPFYNLFNNTIKKNTILLFELNKYHHECLPGYTKYFIDLGYYVDILIESNYIDSFYFFKEIENIRIITFNNIKEIILEAKNLSFIIKKYHFILVQTNFTKHKNLYSQLDILNNNKSFFVSHDTKHENINYLNYLTLNKIWVLGNFSRGLYVNPHYFGEIKKNEKNKKVRFFFTFTIGRNYKYLIDSIIRLKEENLNFDIIIMGRTKIFSSKNFPKSLKNIIISKFRASYSELYKLVESCDYIIIPLDSKNKIDNDYKFRRVTGSIQLVYGFLKPAIINENFSDFYHLNSKNSLIYSNVDLYKIMKKAILLNNVEYNNLRNNLRILEKHIYDLSINNIKKAFSKYQ